MSTCMRRWYTIVVLASCCFLAKLLLCASGWVADNCADIVRCNYIFLAQS